MKKTKIIIPSLGLLLLSTAASVTGTVAWFASNSSVSATGMTFKAKSDSSFLIISKSNVLATAQDENNGNLTEVDLTPNAVAELLPTAHETIANTTDANATGVTQAYDLIASPYTRITTEAYNALQSGQNEYEAVTGTNWYTQSADSVTASASTKKKEYLQSLDVNYIIHETVYVALSVGSNDASNLRVKSASFAMRNDKTGNNESMNAVAMLVTTSSNSVEFFARGGNVNNDSTVLAATVTASALIPIDIYLYYNGNDADVFTNNVANLEGATISISFDVGR